MLGPQTNVKRSVFVPTIFKYIKRFHKKTTQKKKNFFLLFIVLSLSLFIPKLACLQAWVKGSTWIPIFDVDTSVDLGGLSKKVSNFVMGMPLLPFGSKSCPDSCTLFWILHPNIGSSSASK